VLGEITRHAAIADTAEAAHPFRRIRREADPGLLAVVAHVDADLELLPDRVTHRRRGLAGEGGAVDGLSAVLAHEEVAERRRTGEAADVGGEDPVLAAPHDVSGPYSRATVAATRRPRRRFPRRTRCPGRYRGRSGQTANAP
jgi:hypothetical protein